MLKSPSWAWTRASCPQFTFVHETHYVNSIPSGFRVDHAFECCGGEGSGNAIDDIIRYIRPQGTVMLMGVSENKVAVNTRNVLEKRAHHDRLQPLRPCGF